MSQKSYVVKACKDPDSHRKRTCRARRACGGPEKEAKQFIAWCISSRDQGGQESHAHGEYTRRRKSIKDTPSLPRQV